MIMLNPNFHHDLIHTTFRMILRKITGPHFYLPIGKLKVECLHEVLIEIISNHTLANENWNLICTNKLETCISFLAEFLDITTSPMCSELGMYLETVMAVINRSDYRTTVSKYFQLFTNILDNLQLNPNNSVICKCTVFKLPFASPFIMPCKTTTYYCFIEINKPSTSPSQLLDFVNSGLQQSKYLITI